MTRADERFKTSYDYINANYVVEDNTAEERRLAIRNICGARACKGATDAKIIFQALGLNPRKEL